MRGHEYLRHDDKAAAPAGAPETPPMPGGSGAKSPDVRAPERLYFTERGRVTLNHRKKMRYVPYSRRNSIPSVWLRDELRLGSRQVAARSNAPGNAKKARWGGERRGRNPMAAADVFFSAAMTITPILQIGCTSFGAQRKSR